MKSILNKRLSFQVFELPPYLKGLTLQEINDRISEWVFKELKPDHIVDVSTGFINPEDITAPAECIQFDNYLVFSVRTDEYSFSAQQKRPLIERREQEYKRANGTNNITPQVKTEIREEIHKYLKERNQPRPNFVEFFIDTLKDKIVIMSTSTKTVNRVLGLINSAFMSVPEPISLKKILTEKSNIVDFLRVNKSYMVIGSKFELVKSDGTIKTNSWRVTEDLIESEGVLEIPILTGAEFVFYNEKDLYSVYINDSLQMNSVSMPMLIIDDNGLKEADRMNKIMIIWESVKGLIEEHIKEISV